jgi:predicted nucleic acid-binding protein
MKYLLDVNALIGPGFREHTLHPHRNRWITTRQAARLATCAITELGRTKDGHLAALARAHGAFLATFNTAIPGAFVIPNS